MALVPRLNLQYPDENDNPFFEKIKSFFEGLDSHIFANMADRNTVLLGGGGVLLNSTTGVLSWSSDLLLVDAVSGYSIRIVAANATLADGEMLYVDTARVLSEEAIATAEVATSVGVGAGKILLALREGNTVVFRNGAVLGPDQTTNLIEQGGKEFDSRYGTAAFAAEVLKDIVFAVAYPDASYRVVGLIPYFDTGDNVAWITNKTASGFRINYGGVQTGSVDWKTERP